MPITALLWVDKHSEDKRSLQDGLILQQYKQKLSIFYITSLNAVCFSRTRTWDLLINCFKKTDMFCGWHLESDVYKPRMTLLVNYTCRIAPTCRSLGAPCHTHWSCRRAPVRWSLWTSQCWARCWRSSWKQQQFSLQTGKIIIIPTTILDPFWSKADCQHTHTP